MVRLDVRSYKDSRIQNRVILRKAKELDLELLFEWRNHPSTRNASHNTHEISKEEHENWFQASLADPNIEIYIAEENGRPVGTVRVDQYDEVFKLSWTVAPESTGRGIGKRIVREVADKIKGSIKAEIKAGNMASIRIAEYAGLKMENEKNDILFYSRNSLK
jgi:RimJ/RimL family protein N-acetyltransferase